MENFIFYLFSSLAVLSALSVILLPRPTRALLSLIVTMFSLTVLYVLLGAPFVAMVNLIVYAGAVLVLFLFVIMLQGVGAKSIALKNRFPKSYTLLAFIAGGVFFAVTFAALMHKNFPPIASALGVNGSVEAIGTQLFSDYLLPFELISIVLLVGIFAAVALAKEEKPQRAKTL